MGNLLLTKEKKDEILKEIKVIKEAMYIHCLYHDAWHDCEIDFSNEELASLAESYGYSADGDNEWDEDFADECHEYMEEYIESWRYHRRKLEEFVVSRASNIFILNEYSDTADLEEDYVYTSNNEEYIKVLVKENDYSVFIWEDGIYTTIEGKLDDDSSTLNINNYLSDNVEVDIKEIILKKENEGYVESDWFKASRINFYNNKLIKDGFILSDAGLKKLEDRFKEADELLKKYEDKKLTKNEIDLISKKADEFFVETVKKDLHKEYSLKFKGIYTDLGEDIIIRGRYAFELATHYMEFRSRDFSLAYKYFLIGSECKNANCCYELAYNLCYENYFENDIEKADMYCSLAVQYGNESIKEKCIKLDKDIKKKLILVEQFKLDEERLERFEKGTHTKEDIEISREKYEDYYQDRPDRNSYLELAKRYREVYFIYGNDDEFRIEHEYIVTKVSYEGNESTWPKAFKLIKLASESGNASSSYQLAYQSSIGEKFPRDLEFALKHIELALEQHKIQKDSGLSLDNVLSVKRNITNMYNLEKEIEYIKNIKKEDLTYEELDKITQIGISYYKGRLYDKSFYHGYPMDFFDFGVKHNHPLAICWRAICYRDGYFCDKDVKKALEMFMSIYDNEKVKGQVNYELGVLYQKDNEPYFDAQKAFDCLNKAIELGYYYAYGQLAYFHECELLGPNPKARFDASYAGTEQNNMFATFNLAECYEYGINCEVDLDKALELFTKSNCEYNMTDSIKRVQDKIEESKKKKK